MVDVHTYCADGCAMEKGRMRVESQQPNWTGIREESHWSYQEVTWIIIDTAAISQTR